MFNSMQKFLILLFTLLSVDVFSQTVLLSDGFENGKGSWIFSTGQGGNDFLIKPDKGYNSVYAVRCGTLGTPNFMISPAVNFVANKPYKLSFMAYSSRVQSRKIEVYYNTTAALNGSETLIGTIDEVPVNYTKFTLNLSNPPAGMKYIIFKGVIKANPWAEMCIDDVLLIQTNNFIPQATITQPEEESQHTAGKTLNVNVDAHDSDGTISFVQLFYRGELFATKTTAPYQFNIPNLPIGTSSLFARVFDNSGDSTTTQIRTITGVNTAPACMLTLSTTNINQGESVLFTATPVDNDGEIITVSFFVNDERVATISTAPYQYQWSNSRPGNFKIYAVATDNTGLNGYSDTLTVNSVPTTSGVILYENFELGLTNWKVSVSSGANDWRAWANSGYNGTACVRRAVTNPNFMVHNTPYFFAAGIYQVDIVSKAKTGNNYYLQAGLIHGTDTVWSANSNVVGTAYSTYSLIINNTTPNYCNLIVRAVRGPASGYIELWLDDVVVKGSGGENNLAPVVKITSPANSAELTLNSPVDIVANAYDLMGTIDRVDFFLGNEKIGTATSAPYSISWTPTYSGVFSLKAVCTDSEGATAVSAISTYVNYPDRKVYDFVVSSYLGEEAGSGKVWGSKVLSDGVIVLACDWGNKIPEGAVLHLLQGATIDSRGTIVRIAADGKKILSITKTSNYAVDLSIDNTDNIYIAAADKGIIKLNRLADRVLFAKTFTRNVYRVDAGKSGYSVALARPDFDFDGKKWDKVTVYLLDQVGNIVSTYGGASTYTNDVCIDEATQSVVVVGWRNTKTNARDNTNWLPVDIPGFKVYSFSGALKYEGYNWGTDPSSPNWLNRAENNMADTRISRVSMGDDGLMYFMAEVSGGNHPLRYSPYDNMKKVRFVGGDYFHVLSQVGTEFHTFVARMDLRNGSYIEGQSFTARLSSGAGNTLEAEHGNVHADADGRVYFTGTSAYGTPLSRDLLPEVAYTGGAYIYIMNPTLQTRELVDRVVVRNNAYDVGVRKFPNHDKTIVYGGSVSFDAVGKENQYKLFLKSPLQNTFFGAPNQQSGFFAVIGGTEPAQYELKVNGASKGMFAEGTKIQLNADEYVTESQFVHWGNGSSYISDSTVVNTVLSMPGKNIDLLALISNSTDYQSIVVPKFEYFPNPTKGFLTIKSNTAKSVVLNIYDTTGKTVYSTHVLGTKVIDLSNLNKGLYILNFDNVTNKKLVIQ